jgi:hypothetical protein
MAKIKKIVLEIGDKKVELSVKEAKELKEILCDLFGARENRYYPYYYYVPQWYPYRYWYTECDTNGNVTYTTSNTEGTSIAAT